MRVREEGSALIAVLLMAVVIGGMCAAMTLVTVSTHRAASQSRDHQKSVRATDSGLGYYFLQVRTDATYFDKNPAPHDPLTLGESTFQLVSATPGPGGDEWVLDISGVSDGVEARLQAVLAHSSMEIPDGLVLTGTGNPADDVLIMNGAGEFGSYDPSVGTGVLDPDGTVWANGSIDLKGTAVVQGNAIASGWINGKGSAVTGTREELAPETPVDAFENHAIPIAKDSITTNDNGSLGGIFGSGWSPIVGPDNYGDLKLNGGSYILPTGTYRFREVTIASGTEVLLDTSGGSVTLVCAGSLFDVQSGSQVLIDAGGTENTAVTVLEDGASFNVQSGSLYGQEITETAAAGYSQILSTGGTGTIQVQGSSTLYARIAAASRDALVGGGSSLLGSAVLQRLRMIGAGPKFLIDKSTLGSSFGVSTDFDVVARWRGSTAP